MTKQKDADLRRTILFVALANLAYFGVEFTYALKASSVSLFADSIDFLEDASVNFLILIALRWSARSRAKLGFFLGALLLAPGIATLWTAVNKISSHLVPEARTLSVVGLGALLVNLTCAYRLASFKHHHGSLTKAAFLSARNDALANIAIILAGFVTLFTRSFVPDLLVGLGITVMNMDAAKEVWEAARNEHVEASPKP